MGNRDSLTARGARSSLMALQPIDTAPFRHPSGPIFIWASIFVLWVLSLLPWRLWYPAPDLLLLVLAFWCLHEPGRVGLLTAFVFGLLMDVHDTGLLGAQALGYTLVAYGAIALHRRLQHFNVWTQTVHMVPVLVVGAGVARLLGAWLNGEWGGWDWLWSALITGALWPLADILLFLPQRRLDDSDASVV